MSDLISRQAVLDEINRIGNGAFTEYAYYSNLFDFVGDLPSVEPERKPGKWIDGKCNKCGTHAPFWAMATTYYCSEYCPMCGAKMEVEK